MSDHVILSIQTLDGSYADVTSYHGGGPSKRMAEAVRHAALFETMGHLVQIRTVNDEEEQSKHCPAHGVAKCPSCARTLPDGLDEDGECRECGFFGDTGMHWDTCPNRDRSPL